MCNGFRLAGLFVALLIVLPVLRADDKDKKDANADAKQKAYKDKLMDGGVVTGRLTHVESEHKYFVLQIDTPAGYGGGAGVNPYYLQQQISIMQIRNPLQRAMAMRQLALQSQVNPGAGTRMQHHDVEMQAADDIKVRLMNPPTEFDDKGKPKKYTQKELAKLRGSDSSLPGYTGEFDNLKNGQTVKVYLLKKKAPPKPAGKKDKDQDDEVNDKDKRPTVRMVVILAEPREK